MSLNSTIEWTEATWNPITGCTKISSGCKHCYAERMAYRLKAMGNPNYKNGFTVTTHEKTLDIPFKWKKPRMIFVNSMSDMFHENVSLDFIQKIFSVMNKADQHIFQVLTKRSTRLKEVYKKLEWSPNIWMGVTVEDADNLFRIDELRHIDAICKFLSIEPLLGPIKDINFDGIHWVIVGGESGPKARPMKPEWVIDILEQCKKANVPFFFKQWGGVNKKRTGRVLLNSTWDEMPRVQ